MSNNLSDLTSYTLGDNLTVRNIRRNAGFVDKNSWFYTRLSTETGDKMQRCDLCRGQRYATGLGGIRKKCHVCNGVGYVSIEDETEDFEEESADVDVEQEEMEQQERAHEDEELIVLPVEKKVKKRRD